METCYNDGSEPLYSSFHLFILHSYIGTNSDSVLVFYYLRPLLQQPVHQNKNILSSFLSNSDYPGAVNKDMTLYYLF